MQAANESGFVVKLPDSGDFELNSPDEKWRRKEEVRLNLPASFLGQWLKGETSPKAGRMLKTWNAFHYLKIIPESFK